MSHPIKLVSEEEGREKLLQAVTDVLDRKVSHGYVLVLSPQNTWDFNHNLNINQIRDALLRYARDLASYPGD